MSEGAIEFISPDGTERKPYPASAVQRKLAEGWTIAPDQTVGLDTPYGRKYLPPSQAQAVLGESSSVPAAPASATAMGEDYQKQVAKDKYGGRPGAAALSRGASVLTFGGSDALLTGTGLVEPETLAGLEEYNRAASLAGEFVPLIATTIATGGTGLAARALQKTPAGIAALKAAKAGERSTKAFILAWSE